MSKTEQRLAELLHSLRLLRNSISDARPAIRSADDDMDACLASLDDAEAALQGVRSTVCQADIVKDAIDAGDLVETPAGIVEAKGERYHA